MAKYVAVFSDTLEDVEINGFTTMTDREVKTYEELAESIGWSFSYPMGDVSLEFTSGEDLLTRVDFREITSEEFKLMKRIFNGEFGVFIDEAFLEGIASEEGESEEEEDNDDDYPLYESDDDDY